MFWLYIFPVLFAFPLVLPLCLFFLATGIRVFFSNSSELDHGSCGFERGSTVPLPCFLLPVLPSALPSVSFLYSPCSFFFFFFFLVCLRPPPLLSTVFFPLSLSVPSSPLLFSPLLSRSFSLRVFMLSFLSMFLFCSPSVPLFPVFSLFFFPVFSLFLSPFSSLFSSSFSGFYKPKNGLQCNV
ncbi:hypothetical protein NC653_024340 [Populus alba x Populus x berolinensis]|uniref:Uncharacterized protein n=1 Tax=Populus alba x Populus x berolinensis TaxID=444605 RepID=A0AAD6Q6H2_9ROSI|nr:hypothetical protein NC653_024340 [Populus alba x Populus x berolinensis]